MSERPPISITISTGQGWPAIAVAVRSAEVAAALVGGEVVVTDGSGLAAPSDDLAPTTVWRSTPGASVFQLRRAGYELSSGRIVAITEDHCRVPPEWAARMLAAHSAHPEAAAVGGSVENGAVSTHIDWASFLVVQAAVAAPVQSGVATRIAGAVNTSYKREVLADIDDFGGLGAMDVVHQRSLGRTGRTLIADDSIRVVHDQSLGRWGTIAIHFHAGRTFAGFLRARMDANAWLRCVGLPVIPYVRFARAVVLARRKGYGPVVERVWPTMLALFLVQAAGQMVGFVVGPGDSPNRVQ